MAFRTNKTPVLQTKSASGSVATFNTALAMPLPSCNIAVNAWQEGSGDPSPVNDRPIHGFSEVNATRCGLNMLNVSDFNVSALYRTVSCVDNNFTISVDGMLNISYIVPTSAKSYFPMMKKGTYYFLFKETSSEPRNFQNVRAELELVDGTTTSVLSGNFITVSQDFRISAVTCNAITINVGTITFNLYMGVEAVTDLEPYTGNTYTIQLGQEVYGAEVDVVNGVAHVNMSYSVFNGSEVGWVYRNASNSFYRVVNDMRRSAYSTEGKCNKFATVRSLTDYGITFGASNSAIYFNAIIGNIPEVTDLETWKTWLSNNNVQVVYPLATPFDIQLTPTQIQTLIGNNTIFADTGDIDLTYKDLDIAKRGNFREVFKLPS